MQGALGGMPMSPLDLLAMSKTEDFMVGVQALGHDTEWLGLRCGWVRRSIMLTLTGLPWGDKGGGNYWGEAITSLFEVTMTAR